MPAPRDARWCRAVIGDLAGRAGATAHEPHVTLVGDLAEGWRADDVAVALRGTGDVTVRLTDVDDEDERYRCVTLRCEAARPTALRERLVQFSKDEADTAFRPHLSLLYGDLDAARRRALLSATSLPLPLPSLRLTAVAAWDTTEPDWAAWHELARWPLATTDA
jgi:hypothetical protein